MPKTIVGLAMVIFLSTNAFAVIEGEGRCRGAYLAWAYISYEYPDCNDLDGDGSAMLCDAVAEFHQSNGHTDYQEMYNDCAFFADFSEFSLYDFCDCAQMSGDDWESCIADECEHAFEKPYHLRFEMNPGEGGNYSYDVEDTFAGTTDGKVKCYNDNDDQAEGEFYVVKCSCGGYGSDLSNEYPECEESLVSSSGSATSCIVGTTGTTTYLCLPEMYFDMDECAACECYNSSGTWSNSGSGLLSRRKLAFKELDFASGNVYDYGCELASNTEEYACDKGYYRISYRVCDVCPSHSSGEQTSSYANTTGGISTCYVPAGSYSDTTGSYTFSQNCDYKN